MSADVSLRRLAFDALRGSEGRCFLQSLKGDAERMDKA